MGEVSHHRTLHLPKARGFSKPKAVVDGAADVWRIGENDVGTFADLQVGRDFSSIVSGPRIEVAKEDAVCV